MSLYLETLNSIENIFKKLHVIIAEPQYINLEGRNVFRYKEHTPNIAMIQYMAREISGLYSCKLLIEGGFIQECYVIYRTLDEFNQNIQFLSMSVINDDITNLHQKFLDNFFQEEFDNPSSAFHSTQKRVMVPRDKIRAYLSNLNENTVNPSDTQKNTETIDKFNSCFIHGTSDSIIDMYSSRPSKYSLQGSSYHAPCVKTAKDNFEEYLYRAIFSLLFIAKAFNNDDIYSDISKIRYNFEEKTNRSDYEDPNILMKKLKKK